MKKGSERSGADPAHMKGKACKSSVCCMETSFLVFSAVVNGSLCFVDKCDDRIDNLLLRTAQLEALRSFAEEQLVTCYRILRANIFQAIVNLTGLRSFTSMSRC